MDHQDMDAVMAGMYGPKPLPDTRRVRTVVPEKNKLPLFRQSLSIDGSSSVSSDRSVAVLHRGKVVRKEGLAQGVSRPTVGKSSRRKEAVPGETEPQET